MRRASGMLVLLVAAPVSAQSINVNFGSPTGAPASTYAAAGVAGTWNSISGVDGQTFDLVAIDGSPSHVQVSQTPTTTSLTTTDPSVTGDDAKLLDSGLVTTGAETCLSFTGFDAGTYEVLIYAWVPDAPTVKSRTRQDEAASTIDVGGAWTGEHVEGVTYARYQVTVASGAALPAHSGLVPGQPSAALNGIQIRSLSTTGAGPDAGTGGGGGGGGDAGTETEQHGGGCQAAGGDGSGLTIAAFGLVLALRRRRAA